MKSNLSPFMIAEIVMARRIQADHIPPIFPLEKLTLTNLNFKKNFKEHSYGK